MDVHCELSLVIGDPPIGLPSHLTCPTPSPHRPVKAEDEVVVLLCPDPPGADDAIRLVRQVRANDSLSCSLAFLCVPSPGFLSALCAMCVLSPSLGLLSQQREGVQRL